MRKSLALALTVSLFASTALAQVINPYGGGGGSTSPGGTSGQIQYNLSGAFAGATVAGDCTFAAPNFTCTTLNGSTPGTFFTQNFATPPIIGGTTPAAATFTTLAVTGNLTTNVTGSTQCLHVNSSGVVSGTAADCTAAGVTTFNTRSGAVTLTVGDVTGVGGAILGANTFTGAQTFSANSATSTPSFTISGNAAASGSAFTMTGTVFSGTSTTATPLMYLNPGSATAPTTWTAAGTIFGINVASGYTGDLVNVQAAGVTMFKINQFGTINTGAAINSTGAITAGTSLTAGATSVVGWNGRGNLTSPAANTIQIGNTDAAASSPGVLKTQGVIAGTTNTAGSNLTFQGSQGTGTGAGGPIQFQVAPACISSCTATAQNGEVTAFKINQTVHLSYGGTAPTMSACGTSPSIDATATDTSGTITVGTASPASCTLTFNRAYVAGPHCRISDQTAGLANVGYTVTANTLVITGTALSGNIDYFCDGT